MMVGQSGGITQVCVCACVCRHLKQADDGSDARSLFHREHRKCRTLNSHTLPFDLYPVQQTPTEQPSPNRVDRRDQLTAVCHEVQGTAGRHVLFTGQKLRFSSQEVGQEPSDSAKKTSRKGG